MSIAEESTPSQNYKPVEEGGLGFDSNGIWADA